MSSLRRLALIAAVICTALLTPLTADAATSTWTVMNGSLAVYSGVACPSVSFCLAVGANGPQPLVYEWNGSTWAFQTTLGLSDVSDVNAIACASTTYCVAAGDNFLGRSAGSQAAVWVWNGSSWSGGASSSPSRWNHLYAVKCLSTSDCEVAGNQSAHYGYGYHPLAEIWNGSTLTAQPVQGPHGSVRGTLHAVACASASSCEAVGSRTSGTAVAVRWSGTTWSAQKLPAVTGTTSLSGVSCYRTGCTAVGTVFTTGDSTLAEAWNGSRWALQSPAGSGNVKGATDTIWSAVHCRSASNCTVVGTWRDAASNNFTLAETWNGSTWAKDTTPSPTSGYDLLNALSCTPGTSVCTAVGAGGASGLAERN